MVKQIVTWCSPCHSQNVLTEGREVGPFRLPGLRGEKTIDVCEVHEKEFVTPLAELLTDLGAAVQTDRPGEATPTRSHKKRGDDRGNLACRVHDCERRFAYRKSFNNHIRANHDLTMKKYVEIYGDPDPEVAAREPARDGERGVGSVLLKDDELPLDGAKPDLVERGEFDCPECDWKPKPDNQRPAQALSAHRRNKHGVAGQSKETLRRRERVTADA